MSKRELWTRGLAVFRSRERGMLEFGTDVTVPTTPAHKLAKALREALRRPRVADCTVYEFPDFDWLKCHECLS